jgi:membrane protein required for colicin V production
MFPFDYIILGFILLIALLGLRKGFLQTLGSVVGIILAVLIASRFYPEAASWIGGSNVANVIAFVVIFGLAVKAVSLIFWLIGKVFQIITVLPFISTFDRLLGFILGLAEGIFIASIILFFLIKFPVSDWVVWQMSKSTVTAVLLKIADIFVPLFPEAVKKIKAAL